MADAVQRGALGEDHIREVCTALDVLPKNVSPADRETAEQILVEHAETHDAAFVTVLGRGVGRPAQPGRALRRA